MDIRKYFGFGSKSDDGCASDSVSVSATSTCASAQSKDVTNSAALFSPSTSKTSPGEKIDETDLAKFINFNFPIEDSVKYNLLAQSSDELFSGYDFKNDVPQEKRPFRFDWFKEYPWLTYSKSLKGVLCKSCVLFRPPLKRGNFGSFIVKEFSKYKNFHDCAKNHLKSEWHCHSSSRSQLFMKSIKENKSIIEVINRADFDEIKRNREKIVPIISTLLFCGTHDLALRGKNHTGGNFQDLLDFRVDAGDIVLSDHLTLSHGKAKYTSHRIQNKLINICGDVIQQMVVAEANKSCYFSLLADETADISGTEQLSIGFRFVDQNSDIREEFLGFVPLDDYTASGISCAILTFLNKCGINMSKLVGIGFDGCATMAGKEGGVQKLIRDSFPKAVFVHCASHRLNLVVNDLNALIEVRNCVGTIKEVINFFRQSPKRRQLVPNVPLLCETRWTHKYKSIRIFFENLLKIKQILDDITKQNEFNQATRATAYQLSAAVSSAFFLVSLAVIAKYSAALEPVANSLQAKSIDYSSLKRHIDTLLAIFHKHREDSDATFKSIFETVSYLADEMDITLKIPRLTSRQTQRANPCGVTTPEDYFRISIFLPYLDSLISAVSTRFSAENEPALLLSSFEPLNMKKLNLKEFREITDKIHNHYQIDNFKEEAETWFQAWSGKTVSLEMDLKYLLQEESMFFPAVGKALQILMTLPCTTCTIERSFSTLRRVKTWLRSTMADSRLSSLCIISVHRQFVTKNKDLIIEKIISEFGKERRNLKFLFSD